MSICSRHIERNDYCDACYTGVVECSCGKSTSCSQCGGKGWFVGPGKAKYQAKPFEEGDVSARTVEKVEYMLAGVKSIIDEGGDPMDVLRKISVPVSMAVGWAKADGIYVKNKVAQHG